MSYVTFDSYLSFSKFEYDNVLEIHTLFVENTKIYAGFCMKVFYICQGHSTHRHCQMIRDKATYV